MRRASIPQRRRAFVGCEGESERGYIGFLQGFVEPRWHLDPVLLGPGGGDPLALIEHAARLLPERERIRGAYIRRAILLDADLLGRAPDRDFRARGLAEKLRITLIWQTPCHEAFLLRHFQDGSGLRPTTTAEAMFQLKRRWPEYEKASRAMDLRKRLDLAGIRRAMAVEPEFAAFMAELGLPP